MREKRAYEKCSTQELVALYERAATEHGHANVWRDFVAGNPAADRVAAIYSEIRSRGVENQKMLLPLLLSEDIGVRSWAAAHALEFEARRGEAILADIAGGDGVEAFNAKMTLSEWRKGNLRFP
jgi:hypothetical protein